MDATLKRITEEHVMALHDHLHDVRREYAARCHAQDLGPGRERMLAFRFHLIHRQLIQSRRDLGWSDPVPEPPWVRTHLGDSLCDYLTTGG